ncbi:MAG: preprotein translocase subunit SecE [Actinobacteria bacterium]|nr:MAG: preprotein translocase subunit SecE [Actinomycetota bacterium]
MNRQAKRMMQRQKASGQDRMEAMRERRSVSAPQRRTRVGIRQFLKEVRAELKKVAWPSRQEVIAYAVVVLVTVTVLTAIVFGMDFVVTKGILHVLGQS